MKTIIPAAGAGSRMRPHTYTTSKILMKLGKKPIIDYIIENLLSNGIDEIDLILSSEGKDVKKHVQDSFSIKSRFIFQDELTGIAHAVYMASDEFTEEPVLIVLGDTLFEGDLKETLNSEYNSLGVKEVEEPEKFGVVVIDEKGFAKKLIEKPNTFISNIALVGVYFIKNGKKLKDSIEYIFNNNIKTKGEYQITDAIQNMIDRGEKITTFPVEGWYDCGNPENLLMSNRYILKKFCKNQDIPVSTVIGPCYISPNAEIVDSVIGPYVTVGDGTKIIKSVIKDSIIGENSNIEYMILNKSIIGNQVSLKNQESSLNIGDTTQINF